MRPMFDHVRVAAAGMALLTLPSMASGATCAAAIQSLRSLPVVSYDPFLGVAVSEPFQIELSVSGDRSDCNLGLSAAGLVPGAGRTAALNGSELIYRIFRNETELANNTDAVVPIDTGEDSRALITLRVEVPAGQIGLAGAYSDPLTFRLVDRNHANMPLGADAAAAVTIVMENRAEINIAGGSVTAGSGFGFARMDFGDLVQGAVRSAMLQVRSTSRTSLRLTSANAGALVRTGGHGERIIYDVLLDGQPLSLQSGTQSLAREAAPTQGGTSFPFSVRIVGSPEVQPAGDYRDVLTIDVEPT